MWWQLIKATASEECTCDRSLTCLSELDAKLRTDWSCCFLVMKIMDLQYLFEDTEKY